MTKYLGIYLCSYVHVRLDCYILKKFPYSLHLKEEDWKGIVITITNIR